MWLFTIFSFSKQTYPVLLKLSFLLNLDSVDSLVAAANDLLLIVPNDSDLVNALILGCLSRLPQTAEDTIPPFDMNMSERFSYTNWFKQVFSTINEGIAEQIIPLISFLNFGKLKNIHLKLYWLTNIIIFEQYAITINLVNSP